MKERPRVPKTIAFKLNTEGRAAMAMIMQMGEVDRLEEVYDVALTLLKDFTLEVMSGREVASYDPESDSVKVLKYQFLEKIKANRGKIAEEDVRGVLDNLATFLSEEDSH